MGHEIYYNTGFGGTCLKRFLLLSITNMSTIFSFFMFNYVIERGLVSMAIVWHNNLIEKDNYSHSLFNAAYLLI